MSGSDNLGLTGSWQVRFKQGLTVLGDYLSMESVPGD